MVKQSQQSNINQERSAFRGTLLSWAMKDLLGALIHSMDSRRNMLTVGALGETDYHPDTCGACGGYGLLLVPNVLRNDDCDSDVEVKSEDADSGDLPPGSSAPPSPEPASSSLLGTSAPSIPTLPAATALPTVIPPAVTTTAVAPIVVTASPPVVSYPISAVIPGFHSLGPNSAGPQLRLLLPTPSSLDLMLTRLIEERFYAITKGIRVGIFGGCYTRHRTLELAYQAYEAAYHRGSVVMWNDRPTGTPKAAQALVEGAFFRAEVYSRPGLGLGAPGPQISPSFALYRLCSKYQLTCRESPVAAGRLLLAELTARLEPLGSSPHSSRAGMWGVYWTGYVDRYEIIPRPGYTSWRQSRRLCYAVPGPRHQPGVRRRDSPPPQRDRPKGPHKQRIQNKIERLRATLRRILSVELNLERYVNRPVTVCEGSIYEVLYGPRISLLRPTKRRRLF
ncbi:hypothetical protein DFP72DRAFT_859861 [Ephemerocybe angulata]|uniref:Uncharacterized protein n=1 Tax=Ephemerocybe angulata TaxID=980116 RepID=A0A8H6LT52_9AGAR|nr:hypothetical protein DFP72DRAFT_859861 [Tulosesus angulatus]